MVKNIVRDTMLLMRKSLPATKDDLQTARDLADTLMANSGRCAGMAANMIGANKNIIAFMVGGMPVIMLNPRIISHSAEEYEAEEGCLSLDGVRKAKRFRRITVAYEDMLLQKKKAEYSGFLAQVIQHEIDHLSGILI